MKEKITNIRDIFNTSKEREPRTIPLPNATVKMSGDPSEWTEEQVRGIICNPIYTGIGPFPSYISDEEWVTCAATFIDNEGVEQFLSNLLHILRTCFPKE